MGELRQRLGSGQSSVVSYFLNITAFCKDNNETALEVEQDILNSFRKNGFGADFTRALTTCAIS